MAHPEHDETCHSTAGAWLEARERYAAPCRLRALGAERDRVQLLDIGTGLGLNLAAALAALEGTGALLEVVTLERDPDVIRAGFELPVDVAELEPWLTTVRAALARALDAPGGGGATIPFAQGTLELRLGDARDELPRLGSERRFDAVFLDPFSRGVEAQLWCEDFLAEVARRMAPGARLSTYSSSLAVRAALVRAGLEVGRGPRVGAKASGTLAGRGAALPPLDPRTARRLAARAARKPAPLGVDRPRDCLESR
jgi:tRNA U34 5-methylaminomethyl-2-thiouridine-forming methyltransferase MnmC